MNKKFFTLIASVFMLVASLGTVSAQIGIGDAIPSLPKSDDQKYLYQLGVNVQANQPAASTPTTHLLYMDGNANLSFMPWNVYDYRTLGTNGNPRHPYTQTLWCASFGQWDFDGSYPAGLQFLNTKYQKYLMANAEDSKQRTGTPPSLPTTANVKVDDGNLSVWGMSLVFNQNIQQRMPIYSYFCEDSVIVLLYNSTGTASATVPNGVSTARISADDLFAGIYNASGNYAITPGAKAGFHNAYTGVNGDQGLKSTGNISEYLVWVTIMKPAPYILNARDFNTYMEANPSYAAENVTARAFRTTTFTDQPLGVESKNPWESYKLRAHDVSPARIDALNEAFGSEIPGGTGTFFSGGGTAYKSALAQYHGSDDNWVAFELERSLDYNRPANVWLYVDTAYTDIRTQYLGFNWGTVPARNFTSTLPWTNDRRGVTDASIGSWIQGTAANNEFNANPGSAPNVSSYGYNNQFIEGQYYFRLTYNPYNDSLGIDVAQARYTSIDPAVNKNQKWFNERSYLTAANYYINSSLPTAGNGIPGYVRRTWNGYATTLSSPPTSWADYNILHGTVNTGTWSNPLLNPTLPTGLTNPWRDGDYLHVGLVDIEANHTRLFTVHTPPVYAYAYIGVKGCSVLGAITIPEGLYVIGYGTASAVYLGVPINTDTLNVGSSKYPPAMLNIYGTQDPQKMPSYQWVVKHTSKSATSPIKIINREFPNIVFNYVQLLDQDRVSDARPNVKASWFTPVTEENRKNEYLGYFHAPNNELGVNTYAFNYMHALNDKKYLGRGASTSASNTSTTGNGLRVADTKEEWRLVPVAYYDIYKRYSTNAAVPYGYKPDANDQKLGIAQLKRNAYVIRYAEDNSIMHIDAQRIYTTATMPTSITASSHINGTGNIYGTATGTGIQDYGVFLLKTHNTDAKGNDFYAFLDTNSYFGRKQGWVSAANKYNHVGDSDYYADPITNGYRNVLPNTPRYISYTKLSVQDANIVAWAQVQSEERTSAFSIEPYALPIYRRFDGGKYLYGDGDNLTTEKYGDASNSPVYLKFHSTPLVDNYLFENSNKWADQKMRSGLVNQDISFLGVQDIVHYKELYKPEKEGDHVINYEFYVDTAFSKRNATGEFKEPYTPMPQYMLALRPDIIKGGKIYFREGSSIWYERPEDADDLNSGEASYGKLDSIDLPGMVRGMYLFNAIDSINTNAKGVDYLGKVLDFIPNDVRVAFVDGVHLGDTFYVLPEKNNLTTAYIQRYYATLLYNLPAIRKHYLGENTHFVPRYMPYSDRTDDGYNKWVLDKQRGYDKDNNIILQNGKSMVFQFRLRPTRNSIPNEARDFLIETENIRYYYTNTGSYVGGNTAGAYLTRNHFMRDMDRTVMASDYEIAPTYALYLNTHNGAVVRSESYSIYAPNNFNDGAMGFNVVKADDANYGKATSTEATYAKGATVISNTGSISVLNAAGKTVTITNVLGQQIAKTIATSDNATIALPKGIVVVSVDGNSTKAVVK